jgi:hypothetical protein
MARGWEKEDNMPPEKPVKPPTPAQAAKSEDNTRKRRLQELQLQRERVLSERTSSPHRRSALEAALLEIETQLSELGWGIHI